jgi:hypothetical protein
MANKRIIDLAAAGGLAVTDMLEIDTGAVSLRITGQQLYNLVLALLAVQAPLQLNSLRIGAAVIQLNNDGSVFLASNKIQFLTNGTIVTTQGGGGLVLTDSISGNQFRLLVDASGQVGTTPYP